VGLVAQLREQLGGTAAAAAHFGASSQDIIDTAAALLAHEAGAAILADAEAVSELCAELAARHRDTPMLARTLLQAALPTTFGLKAAGWMQGVEEARTELGAALAALTVQLGGPAGTLEGYCGRGEQVAAALAARLGLPAQTLPWHANRVRVARLGGALALLAGAVAKIAVDVTLLAQSEVGEARERGAEGHGGSSSMAHKHNPIAAVSTLACARALPGLAATLYAAMAGEHERAAGAWHAEWPALRTALGFAGSAVAWARTMLESLEVDEQQMRANLQRARERDGFDGDSGSAGQLTDRALHGRS
jgi:3-carboxy-cis,cis-muconate cycloisomerase